MKQKLLFLLGLLLSTTVVFANNKDYYFDKVTVTASGAGKVYASTSADATPEYQASYTLDAGSKNASAAPTQEIYLFAQPENGFSVTWESSDYEITSTSQDNTTAKVTINSQERSAAEKSITAVFKREGTADGSLTISATELALGVGETSALSVTNQSHDAAITWKSAAPGLVSVDATGKVKALDEGKVIITATLAESETYSSAQATCVVTVTKPKSMYQVQNGGFELWDDEDTKSIEPAHWNSFMHATGEMASTVQDQQIQQSNEVRPGSNGQYSARIYSRDVIFGIAAQGNMTTGCINGGSMTASDASGNYNYTIEDDADFNQQLTGHPDNLRVWVKGSCTKKASINCVLHTAGYYQDPEGNEITAQVVAKATNSAIAATNEWQQLTIPFNYSLTDGTRPAYALVTISTSGTPGEGSTSDYLLIDDFEFIYNSELAAATYDGENVVFTNGGAAIDVAYDAAKLALTSNGQGAIIETNYDKLSALLTITIKGDNITDDPTNQHQYTIQFKAPNTKNYTDALMVQVNGNYNAPQESEITLVQYADGTNAFTLKNFMLGTTPVGNINLDNVTINQDGSFETTQDITIAVGEPADAGWIGPGIGIIPVEMKGIVTEDRFEAAINIDLSASLHQIVEVSFGHDLVYNYNRNVTAGNWGTICLPFGYAAANLSGATFYTVAGKRMEGGAPTYIVLNEVADLEAGKPYIFQATTSELKAVNGEGFVAAVDPTDVSYIAANNGLAGTFATIDVPTNYGIYLLSDNKFVLAGEGCTLAAHRAAIFMNVVPELEGDVKGIRFYIEGTDGINAITNIDNGSAVYNLAGQRVVRPAQRGVYVVNGKKVLVK